MTSHDRKGRVSHLKIFFTLVEVTPAFWGDAWSAQFESDVISSASTSISDTNNDTPVRNESLTLHLHHTEHRRHLPPNILWCFNLQHSKFALFLENKIPNNYIQVNGSYWHLTFLCLSGTRDRFTISDVWILERHTNTITMVPFVTLPLSGKTQESSVSCSAVPLSNIGSEITHSVMVDDCYELFHLDFIHYMYI